MERDLARPRQKVRAPRSISRRATCVLKRGSERCRCSAPVAYQHVDRTEERGRGRAERDLFAELLEFLATGTRRFERTVQVTVERVKVGKPDVEVGQSPWTI